MIEIPKYIDDYNHHINSIDIADQLRANFTVYRPAWKNWWPYFYWLLETAIINAYLLSSWAGGLPTEDEKKTPVQYRYFRRAIYITLFAHSRHERAELAERKKRTHLQLEVSEWGSEASLPGKHVIIRGSD